MKSLKIFFAIVGMLAGIMMILFGLMAIINYTAGTPVAYPNVTFADEYQTYQFNTTADESENTYAILQTLSWFVEAVGFFMIAIGIADIAFFGYKLASAAGEREARTEAESRNSKNADAKRSDNDL